MAFHPRSDKDEPAECGGRPVRSRGGRRHPGRGAGTTFRRHHFASRGDGPSPTAADNFNILNRKNNYIFYFIYHLNGVKLCVRVLQKRSLVESVLA